MLNDIWKAIKGLTRNIKIMTLIAVLSAIFGGIQVYYLYKDHNKRSKIELIKEEIQKDITKIDSIYPKVPYKNSDYGFYKINYIEKQLTWTETEFIKNKDLEAIKIFVDALYNKHKKYIYESAECIDAWSSDLFDISIDDDVDSLRKNRQKLTNYYHSLFFDIEDALKLKLDIMDSHYSLIQKSLKQEDKNAVLKELDNWMNDIDYYKYDKMVLTLVIHTIHLPEVSG